MDRLINRRNKRVRFRGIIQSTSRTKTFKKFNKASIKNKAKITDEKQGELLLVIIE